MENPTYAKLTSMHFYGWKQGLKTGCYYLRSKAPVMAQKFTVDPRLLQGAAHTQGSSDSGSATDSDSDSDADSGSDSEVNTSVTSVPELTPEEKKAKERAALKERLAREYEESLAENTGCAVCSS